MAFKIRPGRAMQGTQYSATVRTLGGGKVLARCPELGVSSEGADQGEALYNLRLEILRYLEAFSAPKSHRDPRDINVVVVKG